MGSKKQLKTQICNKTVPYRVHPWHLPVLNAPAQSRLSRLLVYTVFTCLGDNRLVSHRDICILQQWTLCKCCDRGQCSVFFSLHCEIMWLSFHISNSVINFIPSTFPFIAGFNLYAITVANRTYCRWSQWELQNVKNLDVKIPLKIHTFCF